MRGQDTIIINPKPTNPIKPSFPLSGSNMTSEQTSQSTSQMPLEGQKVTIRYEIGIEGGRKKLKVKAKVVEGENRWDTVEVFSATAMLLWKYGHNIPTVRGNNLVASWVVSLVDSKDCGGVLMVTLVPYKEPQDIRTGMYVKKLKDIAGNDWMVESADVNITCSTNKYTHDIHLSFSHDTIIDRYNDKECGNECVDSSLPSQAKINKVHEVLLTLAQAIPLIGWYTGKYTIESFKE